MKAALTKMANQMFSFTIRQVFRAVLTAPVSFEGSSVMITASAASMAASEPMPPMAMPTSARASTGASLMPSPMKAVFTPPAMISSRRRILPSGSRPLCQPSSFRASAAFLAAPSPSPVSISIRFTPKARRPRTASAASAFRESSIRIDPIYAPPQATWTVVPPKPVSAGRATPFSFISSPFPARISRFSHRTDTPRPAISFAPVKSLSAISPISA